MCSKLYNINATTFMRGNYSNVHHFALSSVYDALPEELNRYREAVVKQAEKEYNEGHITYDHFSTIVRALYALDGTAMRHEAYENALVGVSMTHSLIGVLTPIYDIMRRCSERNDPEIASLEPDFIICDHKYTDDEMLEVILSKTNEHYSSMIYESYQSTQMIHVIMIKRSDFLAFIKPQLRNHRWFKHSEVNKRGYTNEQCITDFINCYSALGRDANNFGNNIVQQLRDEKEYILIKLRGGKYYGTCEFVNEW